MGKTAIGLRIAITGARGFIGKHVVLAALRAGHSVRALYRTSGSPPDGGHPRLNWIEGDISSATTWDELMCGANALIHLAASGVANLNDPFDALHTNLPANALLLKAASHYGVQRLVIAGSCFEYGRTGERIGERALLESDPLDPVNIYAAAKAAATMLLQPLSRDLGLQCFILRPFHVYGPGESSTRLIPAVIRAALSHEPIKTTDGRQVRDLVHVNDVAAAFMKAVTANWPLARPGAIVLNISTGRATPIRTVIEEAARITKCDLAKVRFGALDHRPNEMWRLVGDAEEAFRLIGWRHAINWETGLSRLVADMNGAK